MRWLACALVLVVLGLGGATPAVESAESNIAALVIDYGDGNVTYAVVPFQTDSISGIALLRESGLSLVSVQFGGLGDGVCSIEGHGCGVSDCRRLCQTNSPDSPFWKYYVLQDQDWTLQNRGASGTSVHPGDIQGWSWTGTVPDLPLVSFAEVVERAGFDEQTMLPASRTFDESGALVMQVSDGPSWLALGAVVLILAGLVLAIIIARQRRPARNAS